MIVFVSVGVIEVIEIEVGIVNEIERGGRGGGPDLMMLRGMVVVEVEAKRRTNEEGTMKKKTVRVGVQHPNQL